MAKIPKMEVDVKITILELSGEKIHGMVENIKDFHRECSEHAQSDIIVEQPTKDSDGFVRRTNGLREDSEAPESITMKGTF